jgi:DNA-binding response OmpR family regulator
MRIAYLEDDHDQAQLLRLWLSDAGFEPVGFEAGAPLLEALQHERFAVVVLDWQVPGMRGIEVLRAMRARRDDSPVLFLTQFDAEDKVVEALEAGADDYVAKPAVRGVLVARVRALQRRATDAAPSEVEFGAYRTDSNDRAVLVAGSAIALTEKEFELARYLLAHAGKVVTRGELLKKVWRIQAEGLETRTIDTHMSKLRRKLGFDGSHGARLTSIYNHGYRLEAVDQP